MYSWEISKTMETFNYNLPAHIYLDITENSPQINRVEFNAYDSRFEIWAENEEYWNFQVYCSAA